MSSRAQKVVNQLYKGVDPRRAITEFLNWELRGYADTLQKDTELSGLAKKGDFFGIVTVISKRKGDLERKLTQKEIRRIARELVAREKTGGK